MKKVKWEKPILSNLSLEETKSNGSEKTIFNGTCTACGKTNIPWSEAYKHAFVMTPDYTGYLCKKPNQPPLS